MNPELYAAMIGLALVVIASVVAIMRRVPEWVTRTVEVHLKRLEASLAENTKLTAKTHEASDTRLAAALNQAQEYRAIAERYRRLVKELNKIEEARPYLDQAAQALRAVEYDRTWDDFERRLLDTPARSTNVP